jgi:hypothetical protein
VRSRIRNSCSHAVAEQAPRSHDTHEKVPVRQGSARPIEVFVREPGTVSGSSKVHMITCEWEATLADSVAAAAFTCVRNRLPEDDRKTIASRLRITLEADGFVQDVTSLTGGSVATRRRDHVVFNVTGLPTGAFDD